MAGAMRGPRPSRKAQFCECREREVRAPGVSAALVRSRPGEAGGSCEPCIWEAVGPGRRRRMRIAEPKPARRDRHCLEAFVRARLRRRLVQPQGPRHWASLAQASGPSSPSPAWVRTGSGSGGVVVRGRSRPGRPLSVEAGECGPRGRQARGQGGRKPRGPGSRTPPLRSTRSHPSGALRLLGYPVPL